MNTWSNEKIIDFINEIHLHPELWDVESGIYKDRNAKKDGWATVAAKFEITSDGAYKKFRSLRPYAKNEEKKKKSGSAGGKQITWFAYEAISFILSRDIPNTGMDSENTTSEAPDNNVDNEEVVESETTDSLLSLDAPLTPKPRVYKKLKTTTDPVMEKARNILIEAGEKKRNEYAGFGEHIAPKLSKYDDYTRAQAEYKIMQILFECDMTMYRNRVSSTDIQSPDYNDRSGASTSHSQYTDISHPNSPPHNTLQHSYNSASTPQYQLENTMVPQVQPYVASKRGNPSTSQSYETLVASVTDLI